MKIPIGKILKWIGKALIKQAKEEIEQEKGEGCDPGRAARPTSKSR